jgi:hypothetical protein
MGKSFDDYPTMPRINTDGIDSEDMIDRAREKTRFQEMLKQIKKHPAQERILMEFIRV